MQVGSIIPYNFQRANYIQKNQVQNQVKYLKSNQITQSDSITLRPQVAKITFTGGERNMHQIASFAYENKGTGLPEDFQGGLGVVTYEAPQSMIKHEKLDVRSFAPVHEYNNHLGGYKFLLTKDIPLKDGKLPDQIEARYFLSAPPGVSKEEFAKMHNFDLKDLKYVIQSEPNGKEATSLSKYCIIEPTSIIDEIERMSDVKLGETQKIKFQIFKISAENPSYNKLKDTPNYWIWTEELAKTTKPYSYGANGADGIEAEIINSDFCRAYLKAEKLMNTEEFGYWHPANYWGHDRPIATLFSHLANASANGDDYYNGTISHYTAHNPGKNYQGRTDNPFAFARILFDVEDIKALRELPEYELLEALNSRGWNNLKPEEKTFVQKCFEPFIGKFKDFFGNYNLTKVAIVATQMNPKNTSFGTVSPNFDKEMKSSKMDVASGIGGDLRNLDTISPLNGSTPATLGLDNNTADFGRGLNGLSANKSGFTPIIYNGNNIEEVINNRTKNAKWLTGLLEDAEKESRNALNKVLFNDKQIEEGRSILGSLSRFKDGEMLIIGWGRPDEQKGYPILYKGFLKFLKREDVSPELKSIVKLLNGAGDKPWDKNADDFKQIKSILKEIAEYDGGKYKHNAMYVDGFFPNKLVACATHSGFTSRREMCGITPLEAKAAGVPYLTTATGGPVDYTNESNGWRTRTAPEMNPQFDGLDWNTPEHIINEKRIERASDEVSDCLKEMVEEYVNNKSQYIAKCKKNIEEKLDWHNNNEFNGGKSANKMYREDIWGINKGWEVRNKEPLKRLIGRKDQSLKENLNKLVNELTEKISKSIEEISKKSEENLQKISQNIEAMSKKSEENLQKTANTIIAKVEENLNSSSKKVEELIKEITAKSIEEIKTNIENISENTLKNAENELSSTVKSSKIGKVALFAAGIATAAGIGGGTLYAYRGKEIFSKKVSSSIDNNIKTAS